jgi:hypothetical protein
MVEVQGIHVTKIMDQDRNNYSNLNKGYIFYVTQKLIINVFINNSQNTHCIKIKPYKIEHTRIQTENRR